VHEVIKGVAVGLPDTAQGRPKKYPFHVMKVGDGFVVPAAEREHAMAASRQFRRRNPIYGIKFCSSPQIDGTALIWRAA
jgi:hypothetical protein